MEVRKMTITRALNELKLLDNRINDKITSTQFVTALQNDKKVFNRLSVEEFSKEVRENFDSIKDLISNRDKIKKAIVKSNAETFVEVGGVKMTVAEAIERKSSIKYEKSVLLMMENQLKRSEIEVGHGNKEAERKAFEALQSVIGKESARAPKKEDTDAIYTPVYDKYKWSVIDPINTSLIIKELKKNIEDFDNNIDIELSSSNATTFIEI